MGVDADQVDVRPRNGNKPIPNPRHGSHVEGVNRILASTLLMLVGLPAIVIAVLLVKYVPDIGWTLALVLLGATGWLIYRRKA
jgi:uncharacterized protein involved in cysteine biosynthesis